MKILVIGAGWEQYALIEELKNQNHFIVATHPYFPADAFKLADKFFIKDSRDVLSHLNIAHAFKVDAVITDNCDYSLLTASLVCERLGLKFTSVNSALSSNDKFKQRSTCLEFNIKQPEFQKVRSIDELKIAVKKIGFPVVLKPVDSRGTFGVTIINDAKQLEDAYYDAISNSPSFTLICEKFIHGELVTVDGFCFLNGHQSLTVASRVFSEGPKPVTRFISYPSSHSKSLQSKLLFNHDSVTKALGYKFGHTHGEYILTPEEEIFLVECANRGAGVFTSSTINPLITGLNLNEILINQSLGYDSFLIEPRVSGYMQRHAILSFLDLEVGKVLKKINLAEIMNLPFVRQFRCTFTEKQMIESVENCASRHVMVVVDGSNETDLKNNYDSFLTTLNVEYY